MNMKIMSGGQSGVDQAALRAAQDCGLPVGGWCPPGRVSESGVIPAHFPLRETPEDRSPDAREVPRSQRTEWNVRDADATLIIRPSPRAPPDEGTDWTARCAARFAKPILMCDPADPSADDQIRQWLRSRAVQSLNVAGPSESTAPGIGEQTYAVLRRVFRDLSRDTTVCDP